MISNGASFESNGGNSYGSGQSYGVRVPDGSKPASVAWLFTVLIWRL
jgi:hypothetical protein